MSLTVKHHCNEIFTTVKWKFENFAVRALRDNPDAILKSKAFSLYKSRLSFCLEFEPTNRQIGGDKTYSSLYLVSKNLDNENAVQLKRQFWIENENGIKLGNQKGMRLFKNNFFCLFFRSNQQV